MALSKGFSIQTGLQVEPDSQSALLPTLLVVDDEQEITASLADQFRRIYHVVTANSADEALAVMKRQVVSVILSDQRMPGKTGSELLVEACLIDSDSVRILMTGYADIEAVIQAVNQGKIYSYLTKPWLSNEMEVVIAKAVEHNFLLRDNRRLVEELLQSNAVLEVRVKERTIELEQRALELEEANRKISKLVYLDPLTGVANRRSLDETLAREVERGARLGLPLTVAMLDVDHFKTVNDTFGHAMGDKVLQSIAQAVSSQARPYDLVARYGGEEFLIMMPGATLHDGGVAAERFRAAIEELSIEDFPRRVTASFGVATHMPGHSSNSLFERADTALYRAKQGGRNCVEMDNSK
ncbi:MAG: diguanylate cyclase [Steroidobacteraceae bacterium]|nr:diguanylate cyclase [Deltaproteobacteria bacterium]